MAGKHSNRPKFVVQITILHIFATLNDSNSNDLRLIDPDLQSLHCFYDLRIGKFSTPLCLQPPRPRPGAGGCSVICLSRLHGCPCVRGIFWGKFFGK